MRLARQAVARPEVPEDSLFGVPSFRGKRKHADWVQITAYLRRETHREAKISLVDTDFDLSDLLEHLVQEWLEQTKKAKVGKRLQN